MREESLKKGSAKSCGCYQYHDENPNIVYVRFFESEIYIGIAYKDTFEEAAETAFARRYRTSIPCDTSRRADI